MKRIAHFFCIILLIILANKSFAQNGWLTPNTTFGIRQNGIDLKRFIGLPTGCGSPSVLSADSSLKKGGIYFDSCNHRLWIYDPKLKSLDTAHLGTASSGGGGASGISQVLAGYGLTQINDSTLAIDTTLISTRKWRQKGIDSVVSLLGSYLLASDTASLSNRIDDKLNTSDTANHWVPLARTLTINGITKSHSSDLNFSVNGSVHGNGVVNGCQVVYSGSGLTYYVTTPCTYNIADTQYTLPATDTVTLAAGTAGSGEFRTDAIIVDNTSSADTLKGENSSGGVAQFPVADPASQLILTFVRIDETNTTPTNTSTVTVRDEGSGGEWTISKTVTSTDNYSTNPYHGSISQRVTAAGNGTYLRWTMPSPPAYKTDYDNILLYIKNNSTISGNRNISIQLFYNGTQNGNTINLTTYGYVKTISGWEAIAVPLSAFTGGVKFDAIQLYFTGISGSVDVQVDDVQLIASGSTSTAGTQNAITTVDGDSGEFIANSPNSVLNIKGTGAISTSVSGNTVTVASSALTSVDTTNISNFSVKVRALINAGLYMGYTNGDGTIKADTSSSGFSGYYLRRKDSTLYASKYHVDNTFAQITYDDASLAGGSWSDVPIKVIGIIKQSDGNVTYGFTDFSGNFNIYTTSYYTTSSDIEITDYTKGIILRTSDGTRARVTLTKDGSGHLQLTITAL